MDDADITQARMEAEEMLKRRLQEQEKKHNLGGSVLREMNK